MIAVETPRLRLRQWREYDKEPFAQLNADEQVMRYFPSTRTRAESDDLVARLAESIESVGYGFWAAERKDTDEFIGFIGIHYSATGLPFAACVDIGWRLAKQHWGRGFATEGAVAALDYAFTKAGLSKVVSMTPISNAPSENVMRKIGMHKSAEHFYHPEVPKGHRLSEHVLYELTRQQWSEQSKM